MTGGGFEEGDDTRNSQEWFNQCPPVFTLEGANCPQPNGCGKTEEREKLSSILSDHIPSFMNQHERFEAKYGSSKSLLRSSSVDLFILFLLFHTVAV